MEGEEGVDLSLCVGRLFVGVLPVVVNIRAKPRLDDFSFFIIIAFYS